MPIRAENVARYPANWETEIVPAMRARSGNRCERCGVPNRVHVIREIVLGAIAAESWRAAPDRLAAKRIAEWWRMAVFSATGKLAELHGPVEIVLTTAHVDDKNPENVALDNLEYLCQLCHNRIDGQDRADNRKARANEARAERAGRALFSPEVNHAENSHTAG